MKISRFVQAQALDDVLVGVGVDRLLERLAQQVLAALGRGDVAIGAEHDVVGGERIGGDEEAEVALDDQALVVGQPVRVLPQLDVALHVHFLRHPVVGAAGEVLVPRPLYLNGTSWLTSVCAVDDALVLEAHAAEAVLHRLAFHVEVVHRLARQDAAREVADRRSRAGVCGVARARQRLRRRGDDVVVEAQHAVGLLGCSSLTVHCAQLVVQVIRREIHAVVPGDRGEPVVEIELGEAPAVAQRLEVLAVELVREVDHALASIIEFQPDLVVSEIPRLRHMSLYVLVTGQRVLHRAG